MKQKKFLIGGIFLFVLLIVTDGVQQYFYYQASTRGHEMCTARAVEANESSEARDCFKITSAANAAFFSATSGHILTYLVIFLTFIIVGSRLDKVEKRIEELEGIKE